MQKNTSVTLGTHFGSLLTNKLPKAVTALQVKRSEQDYDCWKSMKLAFRHDGRRLKKVRTAGKVKLFLKRPY